MRKYLFGISFALALAACGDGGEETPGDAVCGNGTTESGETCDDGNTSGGDGCSSTCVAEVGGGEACGDGADDDGDGLTDCDDPDCSSTIACLGGTEVCDNGADDDGDGATDCDDTDCAADAACQATAEVCDNGTDDDGDGDADCDDADCAGDAACQAGTEICDNGTDDDGDGDADCDDADCAGDAACQTGTEICDNGTDDDGDGDADCDDADCADDAACQTGTEICDNDTDDDGDGDIDCDDSDCTDDAACAAGPDCGNGTLNDGEECDNGDANSDTTPDACRTNCTNPSCGDAVVDTGEACDGEDDCTTECTFTVGCGNGRVDEGEDCDDGDENSDLIPDACRLGCVAPSCGDGVIDSGESCDDAELNGDDAACLTTCQANVVLACADAPDFVDLSVDGTVTAAGTTYAGTFAGATDDTDAPTGCIEGTVRGEDLVFAFTAPTAGNFAVRTSVASNVADTAIYQLSDCVGGVPGICNDDDGGDFGSKIVLRDLAAGELVYFAVEHVAGAARFSLLVEAVGDVADEGESCAGDTTCAEGLDCIDVGAGPVCMADAAPVLTSLTVQTLASGLVLHRFVGTDPNRDVEGLVIDSITFDDDSVETDLTPTFQPTVAWTGDTFAMDWIADWTAFSGGPLAVEVVAHVFDANGNESGTRAATVAPYAPVEVTEACDITRLTNTCAAPDTCTRNSDGSDSCGAPVAPTLTAGRAVRTGADAVNFLFDGEDANGDVVQWNAEFLDDTGATQVELTFDLDGYTFGLTSYGLQSLITGLTADAGVASVRATLIDATGLESGTVTIALPVPLPAFEGEACDLDGIDAACIDGTVCSPTDAGGICAAPAAPEITSVEAYYLDYDTFESFVVEIEGVDPNGDVETMDVYVTDSDDNFYGPLTLTTANMVPDPTGRAVFAFTTIELLTDGTEFKDAYVGLTDSTGLTSEFVSDPLAIEGGVGAACSFDGADGACDAGTTCGASGVCEVPEPPVLVSATGTRLDETTMMFTAEGTDANGDVLRWVGRLFDADDVALTGDFNFTLGADVHGLTEFTVAPEIGGFDLFPTVSYVTFTLEDDAGLLSNTIRVAVPGVVEVGGDCVGDGITDICADGTRCEAGVCVSSPPTVTAASAAQRDDNIRLLDIEVGGADADNDVTTFTFEFFDADGFSVTGPVAFDAELDAPEGTTYAGDEFVYLITLDWSAIAFWGVADATVFATDSQGQTSDTYAFSFRPVVGLGDECDASEATNICAVGF
ncbi:MAG: hypothetical protein H6697_07940, partial [Myxococcales bacterium]|nr:hypothetical protein [Myxococcales bacterium]